MSLLCLFSAVSIAAACSRVSLDAGRLGRIDLRTASGDVRGVVFLFSDAGGWGAAESAAAAALAHDGAITIGVDLRAYRKALDASDGECLYLMSEIESLSQQVQREFPGDAYLSPILAGIGEGGALVAATLAQTPAATVAGAVAVDPSEAVNTRLPLCPGAPAQKTQAGFVYGKSASLPGFLSIGFSKTAGAAVRAHAAGLIAQGEPGSVDADAATNADARALPAGELLARLVSARLERADTTGRSSGESRDLARSLVEMPPQGAGTPLAIVISGDGGWRDIDKTIAEQLHDRGLGIVGWDSLRYFWHAKNPQQLADDLDAVIRRYVREWGSSGVVLIGYSFGADVLPFAYNRLGDAARATVRQVSLLGLTDSADFEIHVTGWLGADTSGEALPSAAELDRVPGALIQCFYGEDEDDTVCPRLAEKGVESIRTSGGHHFDGDYDALAERILGGLGKRLAPAAR